LNNGLLSALRTLGHHFQNNIDGIEMNSRSSDKVSRSLLVDTRQNPCGSCPNVSTPGLTHKGLQGHQSRDIVTMLGVG
jgi:hypothetical protein